MPGIASIAFRRPSNRPLSVLSHSFPLTLCPAPVPLTLKPCSSRREARSADPLAVGGSSDSSPCAEASLTSSACRRAEKIGGRQREVVGLRQGAKGLCVEGGVVIDWWFVDVADPIGEAASAALGEENASDAAEVVADCCRRAGGGYRAKKARRRLGSFCARRMWCSWARAMAGRIDGCCGGGGSV